MNVSLQEFIATLEGFDDKLSDQNRLWLDTILHNLSAYFSKVLLDTSRERKGEDLATCLEATFSVAIAMLQGIDSGQTGLDDQLAEDLAKLKLKYLGREGTGKPA